MTERNDTTASPAATDRKPDWGVKIGYGVVTAAAMIALFSTGRYLLGAVNPTQLAAIADQHGPAVLGVPAAALSAFIVVAIARILDGPIRFEVLGLKAEGASATATAWALSFLAIVLAVRVLW